jgi:outer membrane protein
MKFTSKPLFAQSLLSMACLAAVLGTASMGAQAQSLLDLYQSAKASDPVYKSAQSFYSANVSKADQAKASILPTANLSATASRSKFELDLGGVSRDYGTQSATLSATQPLYRPGNLASYKQGQASLEQAKAALSAAEQDLLIRVTQAYFDVLASQDSLTFVKAQKTAVAEQLAAAKRNFEVGTSTITDTREAQARYDLVLAQEIAAENDVRVKKFALDQVAGMTNAQPKSLTSNLSLPVAPTDLDSWIAKAQAEHPNVLQAQVALDVATLEIERAKAGHKPTLDLFINYTPTLNIDGSAVSATGTRTNLAQAGVSFNLPLFAGNATQNRYRETVALEEKARNDLAAAKLAVSQATRVAYWGVVAGRGQVKALEAAEASSQSALDANRLGYQVGVRINIDVLNSQSQLFQTKRDLAKARYDVLVGDLKLRQASGGLKAEDLNTVNALLQK